MSKHPAKIEKVTMEIAKIGLRDDEIDDVLLDIEQERNRAIEQIDVERKKSMAALAQVALEIAAQQVRQQKSKKNDEDDEEQVAAALREARQRIEGMLSESKTKVRETRSKFMEASSSFSDEEEEEDKKDAEKPPERPLTRAELLLKADELMKEGSFEPALFCLDDALVMAADPVTLFRRAMLHIGFHNFEEADRDLTASMNLRGTYAEALIERGCIRIKQLQYEEACEDLEHVMTFPLDPKDKERAQNEYRRALRFYGKPRTPSATFSSVVSKSGSRAPNHDVVDEFAIERDFWTGVTKEKKVRGHE